MNTLNLNAMKNLKEKFMNKNGLRVAFSIGAAVIALSTSAYTNRLVPVTYSNVNQASNPNSTSAADYEYRPDGACSGTAAKNCSFTTMQDALPSEGSHPSQAQVNDASSSNSISKANFSE